MHDRYHNVSLPTGVAATSGWQPDDTLPYRVLLGEVRAVTDQNLAVQTATPCRMSRSTIPD